MKKQHILLKPADKVYLEKLVSKGSLKARIFQRATGLLELDRGKSYVSISKTLGVTRQTISHWAKSYKEQGLDCLEDKPGSGRPPKIDGQLRAKITALACSEVPAGHAGWSLRLLADKIVELGYVDAVSHESIRQILKKTNSSLT